MPCRIPCMLVITGLIYNLVVLEASADLFFLCGISQVICTAYWYFVIIGKMLSLMSRWTPVKFSPVKKIFLSINRHPSFILHKWVCSNEYNFFPNSSCHDMMHLYHNFILDQELQLSGGLLLSVCVRFPDSWSMAALNEVTSGIREDWVVSDKFNLICHFTITQVCCCLRWFDFSQIQLFNDHCVSTIFFISFFLVQWTGIQKYM